MNPSDAYRSVVPIGGPAPLPRFDKFKTRSFECISVCDTQNGGDASVTLETCREFFLMLLSRPARAMFVLFLAPALANSAPAQPRIEPPRLFPQISLSRTQIAFAHAGDIWLVSRNGGVASRLTSGLEDDSNPSFSPDGARLAFSRTVGNDSDVYVVPVEGGRPSTAAPSRR